MLHVAANLAALFLLPIAGLVALGRLWSRSRVLAVAMAALPFAAFFVFFLVHCDAAQKSSALRWDMRRDDIIGIVGAPASERSYPDGYTRISYGGLLVHCSLDIYFDRTGKITRMFHDH